MKGCSFANVFIEVVNSKQHYDTLKDFHELLSLIDKGSYDRS